MALLAETFRSPDSRVSKVVVAVDLTNSTAMKEQESEAAWLTFYGWFFDLLRSTVRGHSGALVKFLGDGALAVFTEDNAADAINWAIEVQEGMLDGLQGNRIPRTADCSVGIAFGEVVEFDTLEGTVDAETLERPKDYIGPVVDKAFRLCSAANAKAIFVDSDTVAAAAMNKVKSRVGTASVPRRTSADYRGPEEQITVKGFSGPVPYHEIFWANTRFGVSAPFVTKLSTKPPEQSAGATAQPGQDRHLAKGAGWARGLVVTLREEGYGFVKADSGSEEFYFNSSSLFRQALPVKLRDRVWFIPADPIGQQKKRRATDVIALGAKLDGKVERLDPKGFGFVVCPTDRGELRQLFVYFKDVTPWSAGKPVSFTVGENKGGIAGENAESPEPVNA